MEEKYLKNTNLHTGKMQKSLPMFEALQDDTVKGGDVTTNSPTSMSCSAASLAKTSAQQDIAQVFEMVHALAYGTSSLGSLANYDREQSCWRTSQPSLIPMVTSYSVTLPRWGMMQDGVLYPLAVQARLTDVTDGSVSAWQTPKACDVKGGTLTPDKINTDGGRLTRGQHKFSVKLTDAVNFWATPKANDSTDTTSGMGNRFRKSPPLTASVAMAENIQERRYINPQWLEQLMGYPPDWTALDE